jgi:integrase
MADSNPTILAFPSQPSPDIGQMLFPLAAEIWLATRIPYISGKTLHEYELNIRTLSPFFSATKLGEITSDQIRAYQQKRREALCGPSGINHECSVLQQMLKRIGRWADIEHDYQALPLPKSGRGRALEPEEKERLFKLSETNPNWEAAFLFALILVNTTAGPKESATLRLKDIDLAERLMKVQPEGAKNQYRIRPIPLNDEAFKAVKAAIARARRLGASNQEHYLFPFRIHRSHYDPTRHQTSFKGAWLKMVAAAGLRGFRLYDLRHHAVTVLLENPSVSLDTAETIAGHISRQMQRHYSHVRWMPAARLWADWMAAQRYSRPMRPMALLLCRIKT